MNPVRLLASVAADVMNRYLRHHRDDTLEAVMRPTQHVMRFNCSVKRVLQAY